MILDAALGNLLVLAIVGFASLLTGQTIRTLRQSDGDSAWGVRLLSRIVAGAVLFALVAAAEVLFGRAQEVSYRTQLWFVLWASMFIMAGLVAGAGVGSVRRSTVVWLSPPLFAVLAVGVMDFGGVSSPPAMAGAVAGGAATGLAILLAGYCGEQSARKPARDSEFEWIASLENFATEEENRQCPICRTSRWVSRPRSELTALRCPRCGRVYHAKCFYLYRWHCPNSGCTEVLSV